MTKGEVWFVEFPYDDAPDRTANRPVVVLDENVLGVLSVKITKHTISFLKLVICIRMI